MDAKKAPLGTGIPIAAQRKLLHKQYTRNLAKMKEHYFMLYVWIVLALCCVTAIGFWAGFLLSVMLL